MSQRLSVLDREARERRLFDSDYYRRTYPEVAATGIDLFHHFMVHGWVEGRNPSSDFIILFYRDRHLEGACLNPLTHYVRAGAGQGLRTAPDDLDDYLALQAIVSKPFFSPDVYAAHCNILSEDLLFHYLSLGSSVDFPASSIFSLERYRTENNYIDAIGISPLYHFASQHRMLDKVANYSEVISQNPDIRDRLMMAVLETSFDCDFYLANNPSVREAGIDPLRHYVKHGWREGLCPNVFFNPVYYLEKNPEVAAAGQEPFFHYLREGLGAGRRGSAIGERFYMPMTGPSDAAWDALTGAVDVAQAMCLVVMRVYDRQKAVASIYSILSSKPKTRFALIVLRTPDERLAADLERLASRDLLLYANTIADIDSLAAKEGGNKALLFMRGDALVYNDWLDRLMAHAGADPSLATLSPLGNDVGIGSYPVMGQRNRIEMELPRSRLDWLASQCNHGHVIEVPAGAPSFFMVTSAGRAVLTTFDFDTIAGRECDLFSEIRKAGYKNGLAEDVFIYREDEGSGQNDRTLAESASDYQALVAPCKKSDPGYFGRMRLDLARMTDDLRFRIKPSSIVLFVYHSLSGGVLTYVRREEERLRKEGVAIVHLRVGIGNEWDVDIGGGFMSRAYFPNLKPTPFAQFAPHLIDFLYWLKPSSIRIQSLVGFDWRTTLAFMDLIYRSGISYQFVLHDYAVVCHRHTLITPAGTYCGLPSVKTCRSCVASDRSHPEAIDPHGRRQAYAKFLAGASAVIAPSNDIANRLRKDGARYRIDVVPHAEVEPPTSISTKKPDLQRIDIVIFGAIGLHKGSDVILNLAVDASRRQLPLKYHIIGYSNQTPLMFEAGVAETGPYPDEKEALRIATEISPLFVLVPSIWPETFSYTLSLAFTLGVKALVFDLGAPADRVRQTGLGHVLPLDHIDHVQSMNDTVLGLAKREALRWTIG